MTSGCRRPVENVWCLSSLMADRGGKREPPQQHLFSAFSAANYSEGLLFFKLIFLFGIFLAGCRPSNRKLPSKGELIKECRELLATSKRKRKRVCFEFSTDPVTGVRSNKGTYMGQQRKKRREIRGETCENLGS